MNAPGGPPRAADFGLTGSTLERTPEAFFVRHREVIVVVAIGTALIAATGAVINITGSISASAFFVPLLGGASLILLLPVVLGCVCGAGAVETWWRSRSDKDFAACARYRKALAAFQVQQKSTIPPGKRYSASDWLLCSQQELVSMVGDELGQTTVISAIRELSGYDLLINDGVCTRVVRCEAGRQPVPVGIGRELQAVLSESGSCEALLVAPAGPTPALHRYMEGRSIRVIDASELARGGLEHVLASAQNHS